MKILKVINKDILVIGQNDGITTKVKWRSHALGGSVKKDPLGTNILSDVNTIKRKVM